jgi:hypothetical protein
MTALSISNSEVKRFFKTSAIFVPLLAALYITTIFIFSNIRIGSRPLMSYLFDGLVSGGFGHTLARFQEIDNYHDIDILFLGSSHVYRSFDPRIFKQAGFKIFNMGTTSQTPLNSYHLFKRYEPFLKPKVLVYECYFGIFESDDGLESLRDLVFNLPLSRNLLYMAWEGRSLRAITWILSEFFGRMTVPWNKKKQMPVEGDAYVSGGYVENNTVYLNQKISEARVVKWSKRQFEYLERILSECKIHGIKAIVIVQPVPKNHLASIKNYDDFSGKLEVIASSHGADYYDFTKLIALDDGQDYMDEHHLNAQGVKKFNHYFLQLPLFKRVHYSSPRSL